MKTHTIDSAEIAHFSKDSAQWWDPNGPFRPLHWMTPVRMKYIRSILCSHYGHDTRSPLKPLTGLKILDIGCGGGLACEPLTRMGADVTGIDADVTAIQVATSHALQEDLSINYIHGAAEDLIEQKRTFDVLVCLEVIEHVSNRQDFVMLCSKLLNPGGIIVFSTLNRTAKSYALGIIAAEYILRWAPRGTHDWKKFLKPSELAKFCRQARLNTIDIRGVVYRPLTHDFELSKDNLEINYFLVAKK